MGELDELASAAGLHETRQQAARTIRRQKQIQAKIGAIAVVGVIAVIASFLLLKSQGVITSKRDFDLKFYDESGAIGWWVVTNESNAKLKIDAVRVNGEYSCLPGTAVGNDLASSSPTLKRPAEIAIGESAFFLQYEIADGANYRKRAIYVDVETNRGTHRYRVGAGWE